jgi:hypothetical protein
MRGWSSSGSAVRRGGWQTGCLIALAVVAILVVAAVVTVMLTWKRFAAMGINAATENIVASSGLPQDQKDRILKKVHGLTDDFKAGKITNQQFADLAQSVSTSPLLPLGIALAADKKYIAGSGLTDAEKELGRVSVRRFARGMVDGVLHESDMQAPMAYISKMKGPNQYELKKTVPDEDLRRFIKELQERSDKSGVAADAAEINIADEVEKLIDKGLGKAAAK